VLFSDNFIRKEKVKKKKGRKRTLSTAEVMNMLFDEPPQIIGKNTIVISTICVKEDGQRRKQ